MLTSFFCTLTDWPPWTDGLTDWPPAHRGQRAGSPRKERGMFNLSAPQTTTTCLLLNLIYFSLCVFLCFCLFLFTFVFRFSLCLSPLSLSLSPAVFPTPPLPSHVLISLYFCSLISVSHSLLLPFPTAASCKLSPV